MRVRIRLLLGHPHSPALLAHQLGQRLAERRLAVHVFRNHQFGLQLIVVASPQKAGRGCLGARLEQIERNPNDLVRVVAAQQLDAQLVQQQQVLGAFGIPQCGNNVLSGVSRLDQRFANKRLGSVNVRRLRIRRRPFE